MKYPCSFEIPDGQSKSKTLWFKFQIELTCSYPPDVPVACPKILRDIKEELVRRSLHQVSWYHLHHFHSNPPNTLHFQGDIPTQYLNTPTCDYRQNFGNQYWGLKNYPTLEYTKKHWDPDNVFHFCQSVGSKDENCCPQVQNNGYGYPYLV